MHKDESEDLAMSIDRPRDASDGTDEDGPDIYRCPVEGCDRTVIGDSTAMRNHVRNLEDDLHRGKVLDDEMELETEWGDWSPGFPDGPEINQSTRFSNSYRIQPASECSW